MYKQGRMFIVNLTLVYEHFHKKVFKSKIDFKLLNNVVQEAGANDRFFNSSTTGKKTSKEHEKTEKEVSEDEETSSSRNTCDGSVSLCSAV